MSAHCEAQPTSQLSLTPTAQTQIIVSNLLPAGTANPAIDTSAIQTANVLALATYP